MQSGEITDRPLVSVIIIFLNEERFLVEAIESVFAQTYDAWELILVDDGSVDESVAIVGNYAEQWPEKVRCLQHPGNENCGTGPSRNLGIAHANGKYIAFLDADDVWLPHKLEQQVAILEFCPEAAMVYGPTKWWYSWTGRREDQERDFTHDLAVPLDQLIEPPTLIRPFFLTQEATIPNPSNVLIRRSIVEQVGGFDETFRATYEDQALFAKICLQAPVLASGKLWDRYRQHPDSITAEEISDGKALANRLFFLKWLEGHLTEQGFQDAKTMGLLRREIWRHRYPIFHSIVRYGNHVIGGMKQALLNTHRKILRSPGPKAKEMLWAGARNILPDRTRHWLWTRLQPLLQRPPVGWVRLGSLRRVTPINHNWGYERGQPIDRYYIENFLGAQKGDICGHVLEVMANTYTRRFGGQRVRSSDVLDVSEENPKATVLADLANAEHLPADTYDCIIVTQTLQFVYDVGAAIQTLHRILKPGGVLLVTVPGISQISRYDMDRWGHYWSFTSASMRKLFEGVFPTGHVTISTHGNVLAAISFLHGLAADELRTGELDYHDDNYQVIIAVRAVKSIQRV